MRYRILVTAALLAVIFTPAAVSAQTSRVEVSGIFGWTTSDGVDGNAVLAGDGNIYDAIDVKDSFSWGFGVGFNATENAEVGFLFNQQLSTLRVQGTATRDIGDMNVNSYHPYFAYNFLPEDSTVRPYVLIGLGATNYASVAFTGIGGVARETGGETQFSTTWGAGVKFIATPNVGIRVGAHWTPTYIKTDEGGWWCDPYWGCYVVGDPQYANQLHFQGGVTARF